MLTTILISMLSAALFAVILAAFVYFRRSRALIRRLEEQIGRNQFQTSLLNILVHDIMNPILAARFSVENLKRHSPSELHSYVNNALTSIEDLNELVKRARDLRAYDTGRKRLYYAMVHVNDMLVSVQKTFQDRLNEKGIALKVRHDASVSQVEVDPVIFLSNVLNNIFDNAIKFSRKGTTIELAAYSLGDDVEFMIKDQGIGMQKDLVENLFSGLLDNVRTTTGGENGSGIGMMQVAKYMNLAGGQVRVESSSESANPQDHGTTFRVRLPKHHSEDRLPSDKSRFS